MPTGQILVGALHHGPGAAAGNLEALAQISVDRQVCDIVGDWWDSAHERVDLSTEYMQADVKLCFDGPLVNVCEEEEELDAPITRQQTTAAAAGEEEKTQADSE